MNPKITLILQHKVSGKLNELGNETENWEDVQILIGIIREPLEEKKNDEGVYDKSADVTYSDKMHIGYFASFRASNTIDYRVKCVDSSNGDPDLTYYDIVMINPNLIRRNRQNHVEVSLRLI